MKFTDEYRSYIDLHLNGAESLLVRIDKLLTRCEKIGRKEAIKSMKPEDFEELLRSMDVMARRHLDILMKLSLESQQVVSSGSVGQNLDRDN